MSQGKKKKSVGLYYRNKTFIRENIARNKIDQMSFSRLHLASDLRCLTHIRRTISVLCFASFEKMVTFLLI